MIKADPKPFEELVEMLDPFERILILGCGTCVTICFAGGEREVAELGGMLRLHDKKNGRERTVDELTVQRQCEDEFIEPAIEKAKDYDVVLSMACGVGVNFMSERIGETLVFPAVDTRFLGATLEPGVWEERCAACGECIVHLTGGICPVARCSKSILNGPCGGTDNGKCEVSTDENPIDCAWALIVERCKKLGTLDKLKEIMAPKDWAQSRDGGPRRRVRPDLKEEAEVTSDS